MRSSSPQPSGGSGLPDEQIYTVSELNREAGRVLEDGLPALWVTGEISNLARPGSGHIYFSLKDEQAQVRCAMFRGANRTLQFQPEDGLQVMVRARVTIYEPRGTYQLIVEHMEPGGEGLLRRQFDELKARLAAEGLFEPGLKQSLPILPRQIGIITSPTGAAIRDILRILQRRFAAVPVVVYPVQVQGPRAKHDIVAALATAVDRADCDVLIVARGGGSLEDLWAFNEEIVARAIHACPIAVVSAVGHEVDFTIADLVADLRAPTPSGAAELVVPDARVWLRNIESIEQRAMNTVARIMRQYRNTLQQLTGRLQRRQPGLLLQQQAQRLDELAARMVKALKNELAMKQLHLANARAHLRTAAPDDRVQKYARHMTEARLRLDAAMRLRIGASQRRLAVITAGLQTVSPLSTLERGYTIITDTKSGEVIRDADALRINQPVTGTLAQGGFEAIVKTILKS
jgi:exodeoxyribonuclease VII large subunit